ncbi:hypothetical protein L905_15985 [Agrobacterium sp. TS43]|nr:hypothetical protein L902_06350 [Agrobacterium radiobacter DSM 30147]KVK48698.1 hypothetical protein L904_21805 [Agrobacterium sp. LY4]KVK48842.1 hypothetical protein L903_21820 [Agrobacterium sp. JL28]KVK61804.1 hypothetical protein L906_20935 [Agrobacterium sp. TS45]KVK66754.1 hypothetical protein L907_20895 [Agrobacterium sp. C13]KVK67955.1 hypothetical protein L905_15985 [Agrobacterium sp. TS43]
MSGRKWRLFRFIKIIYVKIEHLQKLYYFRIFASNSCLEFKCTYAIQHFI